MTDLMPGADPVTPDNVQGTPFTTLLLVEGLESDEGPQPRLFELGTTTWRTPPIPLMVRDTSVHGPGETPDPTWVAGQVDSIYRDPTDPSRIMGRGHLIPNADGARAEEIARHGFRGVSVDGYNDSPLPPDLQAMAIDQDGNPAAVLTRYADIVIDKLTLVPTSAIEGCCLWFDDETQPPVAAALHGAVVDPNAPPEVVMIQNPYEQLVASAGGPLNPPREWFFAPEPDEYQPLETTPDGRVTGHIAREGQCHLANKGRCDTAPASTSVPPYKAFHRTTAVCDDGSEVACGWLTVDAKHDWNMQHTASETADYYDHTGSLGAKLRLSNGVHGVWASGVLLPGLDDRTLAIMQGPEVSGDWRTWTDPDTNQRHGLELQGVLAVPFPAFPGTRTRPELLVASGGEIVAQVGPIVPDCEECNEETVVDDPFLAGLIDGLNQPMAPALVASQFETLDEGYVDALIASMDDPVVALSPRERALYFAKYDKADRDKLAKSGDAMADGSYPIADEEDLKNAIRAVGRGAGSHNAIRKHIMRRAKALNKSALIPSDWNADGTIKP